MPFILGVTCDFQCPVKLQIHILTQTLSFTSVFSELPVLFNEKSAMNGSRKFYNVLDYENSTCHGGQYLRPSPHISRDCKSMHMITPAIALGRHSPRYSVPERCCMSCKFVWKYLFRKVAQSEDFLVIVCERFIAQVWRNTYTVLFLSVEVFSGMNFLTCIGIACN